MDTPPLPPPQSLSLAWRICKRAPEPQNLDVEMLILALLHAAARGAAHQPGTSREATRSERIEAARLYAALQLKLIREPRCLEGTAASWPSAMLAALPKPWAVNIRHRLAGHTVDDVNLPTMVAASV